VSGEHYASARAEALAETIRYYLAHERERQQMVEAAYELVTTQLTLRNSLHTILSAASAAPSPAS
jgi:spore maturation protein CgeB